MKKFLLILGLIISVFACGCSIKKQTTLDKIKENGVLRVGVNFEAKPFCYKENGVVKGFDIDIAKAIAKDILGDENKIKYIEVNSETRISKLMSEEADIIVATMTDNEERREIIDFSQPYYYSGQAVLCKVNSEVTSVADLSNHNTAVVVGTTAEKTLKKLYNRSNILRFRTHKEAFDSVRNTNDTCFISDESLLMGFMMDSNGYQIFNKKLTVEPYAVALRKDEPELKDAINYTLSRMEQSGEFEQLTKKWVK